MQTPQKVTLLVFATIAVVLGMAHLFWPGGLEDLMRRATASRPAPVATAPATTSPTTQEPPSGGTAEALRQADAAYDSGDFGRAVDLYLVARTDADKDFAARALRGLSKAVLAWGLTTQVPVPSPLPDDPDAEIARRQAAADRAPSEQAWYDLTIYAAGCGSSKKLPFLARQAIDCARTGGPVETRLKSVLEKAGPRGRHLRTAMEELGFLEPVDPVAAAEQPKPATKGPYRPTISPPGGTFTPATKQKLVEAVEFEKQGAAEYDLSGPDNPNRKEHRKSAMDLLKKARDIYELAQEEDSSSASLDRRMHDVMEMISHLRKEMNLGE